MLHRDPMEDVGLCSDENHLKDDDDDDSDDDNVE
jgi:hypothetical protein